MCWNYEIKPYLASLFTVDECLLLQHLVEKLWLNSTDFDMKLGRFVYESVYCWWMSSSSNNLTNVHFDECPPHLTTLEKSILAISG